MKFKLGLLLILAGVLSWAIALIGLPPKVEATTCRVVDVEGHYEHQHCTADTYKCPDGYSEYEDQCRKLIVSSETQTASPLCPTNYHYQNTGNWDQRCHRNDKWTTPNCWDSTPWPGHYDCTEHVSPSCPVTFTKVGNTCSKTVDTSYYAYESKILDTAGSCGEWEDGEGENQRWVETTYTECIPSPTVTPTATPTVTPTATPTVEPTPTGVGETEPTPTVEPTQAETRHEEPQVSSGGQPESCREVSPIKPPANPLVWRKGPDAIVQWFPTDGLTANVYYYNIKDKSDAHAVRDTENDGYVKIGKLGNKSWTFGIQQVTNKCAGGIIVWIKDSDNKKWRLFRPSAN